MVDDLKINRIATSVAEANLTSGLFSSVKIYPTTDSQGYPALRITIVVTPGSTDAISGEAALNTLSQIQRNLLEVGEDRVPIVEYATEAELTETSD